MCYEVNMFIGKILHTVMYLILNEAI